MNRLSPGPTDRLGTYLSAEKGILAVVTVSGLIYNIGLAVSPRFEGQLAQCLLDIFRGSSTFRDMGKTALAYLAVIAVLQIARYFKRLYVRRFANDLNLRMKHVVYDNLVHRETAELAQENVGAVMTKAISDVEACVEGVRKFTTEIFDTGVAMIGYMVLLLVYDWRLALFSMIFPPVACLIAERMKTIVQRTNASYKESSGRLSASTLDRIRGALTYRVTGCEEQRDEAYEEDLKDYERRAVRANIWVSALQPLYQVISMTGVLFILWFGAKNVLGTGWTRWDIAAFTAFLSCFTRLSVKTSKTAKLFNAVHKAQVSWKRVHPLLRSSDGDMANESSALQSSGEDLGNDPSVQASDKTSVTEVCASGLGFAYPGNDALFTDLNFTVRPGEIVGITGPVACGKSTLGRIFLNESPYLGSLTVNGEEMSALPRPVQRRLVGYLGHDPEIFSATIRENVLLGMPDDTIDSMHDLSGSDRIPKDIRAASDCRGTVPDSVSAHYLRLVRLDTDIASMPEGAETLVGSGGIRLSGGQQQRLGLARTLAHRRPILVLDDPFSALDRRTEEEIFAGLRQEFPDTVIFLISHRLYLFPQCDQVIWMNEGCCTVSDHASLLTLNETYAELYYAQVSEDICRTTDCSVKTGSAPDVSVEAISVEDASVKAISVEAASVKAISVEAASVPDVSASGHGDPLEDSAVSGRGGEH